MPDTLNDLTSVFVKFATHPSLTAKVFVAIGGLWSLRQTFSVLGFARLYFLRSSSLKRYITASHGDTTTWALVTGASDGIGKGFAEELCSRGVDVVLHGRNERKLQGVKEDLLSRWPARHIRLLVLDAGTAASDASQLEEAAASLQDLNLRILVNNVGGAVTPLWAPLIDRSSSDVGQFIDINARFPTEITRVLLPQLTRCQPSLIINIGSGASDFACPYIEVMTGAKAYNQAWSKSLRLEMQAEKQDIEVLHFQVGMVQSNAAQRATSLLVPSSRQLARRGLDMVGCGREVVWPYWPHAVQFGFIGSLPEWLRNRVFLGISLKEKALEDAQLKSR
ncbi:hypothetical protein LTR70_009205 [Exophiala xenobiotica]|uniref:NAD(P)-binding protein n=1 Tax=Lithohypha guttulata TaxID=1690604 RepID=A0ABR0JWY7_9EURO|nr:hypothetical protein LTR24_009465 [Lithohypha guttulata]KAK5310815.1 hypothetical protein LTR70_009205 [Exophiala xenobiotica]